MLQVNDLVKKFNGKTAVDHVSFHVNRGEIFGFLGPNGAGKTTTINMICSLLKPDQGTILLDGHDLYNSKKARSKMGVVPQDIALYEDLSARDNLAFWGKLYGMKGISLNARIQELLDFFELAERSKEKIKNFSGGMKRRLNLAAGIIHRPELLLLDEPTVGIDPQARKHILEAVKSIAESGTTIIYTTHYLDEAEKLCDSLAIIDHGKMLTTGTLEDIVKIVGENRLLKINGTFSAEIAESLTDKVEALSIISVTDNQVLYSLPSKYGTGQFIEMLTSTGIQIENLSIKEPSLDSVFIKLTGRELRD